MKGLKSDEIRFAECSKEQRQEAKWVLNEGSIRKMITQSTGGLENTVGSEEDGRD